MCGELNATGLSVASEAWRYCIKYSLQRFDTSFGTMLSLLDQRPRHESNYIARKPRDESIIPVILLLQ